MAVHDSNLPYVSTWCPGCGNFGIYNALKKALGELDLDLEQVALVTGIGCSGKIAQYVNAYRIETLHGRTLPVASGIKMANHTLTVIAEGGDGDGMGLGIGHFIHTARRNLDITYFLHNNQIYGLTKGQPSPTSDTGMVTKFTPPPQGNIERSVNVVQMALSAGATFVARGFAANIPQLVQLMKQAIAHRGFAVVDILQQCVTFNKLNTLQWYQQRVVPVENIEGYEAQDLQQALALSMLWGDRIPVGVFYQTERPTYGDSLRQLEQGPLVHQAISDIDIASLMKAFG